MSILHLLFFQCLFMSIVAMPYYVPLQGITGGKRTLVYLDNLLSRTTFSSFFNSMTIAGHSLTYVSSNDDKIPLLEILCSTFVG